MNLLHEWPLVLFTLAVQSAVGLHLALLAVGVLQGGGGPWEHGGSWGRRPYLLVGVLMAAALPLSAFHLGAPGNALRTLANLDESWLSREILAALVFLGLWGLGYGLGRRPGTPPGTSRALAGATGLAGIVLIWVMARIYMVPARPLWDDWLTSAGFFATTLLLGPVILAARGGGHRVPSGDPDSLPSMVAVLIPVGLAAVTAQVAVTLAHPVTREAMVYPEGPPLVALRLFLLLGGGAVLVIPLARGSGPAEVPSGPRRVRRWSAAGLLLLGASEILGRMLFYAVGPVIPF